LQSTIENEVTRDLRQTGQGEFYDSVECNQHWEAYFASRRFGGVGLVGDRNTGQWTGGKGPVSINRRREKDIQRHNIEP
jgi:hypothetical protein